MNIEQSTIDALKATLATISGKVAELQGSRIGSDTTTIVKDVFTFRLKYQYKQYSIRWGAVFHMYMCMCMCM